MSLPKSANLFPLIFLFVLTLAVFGRSLGFDFVAYDDPWHVLENPHVRAGLTRHSIEYAFGSLIGLYHPITWLSLMMDVSLWGVNPHLFHLTNLTLHAVNGLLVFSISKNILQNSEQALVASAIFLAHPLVCESVAWISERKGLLATAFALGAIAVFIGSRDPGRRLWPTLVLFACSFLCKPVALLLPFWLVLWASWPPAQTPERGQRSGAPPHAAVVASALTPVAIVVAALTIAAEHNGGVLERTEFANRLDRVSMALQAFFLTGRHIVWPSDLSVFYSRPPSADPLRTGWGRNANWTSVLRGLGKTGPSDSIRSILDWCHVCIDIWFDNHWSTSHRRQVCLPPASRC